MGLFDSIFGTNSNSNNVGRGANCVEFSTDISTQIGQNDIISCSDNGVQLHNVPSMMRIVYDGLLVQGGAVEIHAVVGYGDNGNWQEVEEFPMVKTSGQSFELLTQRKKSGNVNIVFRDGIGNWDNNTGQNYVFYGDIAKGSH